MKTITLQKLSLDGFQGGTYALDANGEDLNIYAGNGKGKTRLFSAVTWLLFGKDSLGRSDFAIKNINADGEYENGLDHSVEAVFGVDGVQTTFRKVLHEVWSKKRGSAQAVLTGNTVDHFIDSVPVKENEYKAKIAEITGDETIFRLLLSPTAFPALPWQKQRAILLDCCGDITDAQVIASDDALAPLTELLKKYAVSKTPLDDLRKVTLGRRTEINKQIDQLPVRIDEVRRGLPNIEGLDLDTTNKLIVYHEQNIADRKLRLAGVDMGGTIADLTKQLTGIESDITRLQNGHFAVNTDKVMKLTKRVDEITTAKATADRQAKATENERTTKQERIDAIGKRLDALRERWKDITAREFTGTVNDTCPACGQSLPHDQVEAARERALAEFNRKKAQELTDIDIDAKGFVNEKNRLTGEIAKLNEATAPIVDDSELEALTAERDSLRKIADDYTLIPGREELLEKKSSLEEQIKTARESVASDKEPIQKELTEHETGLRDAQEKARRFVDRETGEKRVEDLKATGTTLAKEFDKLEHELFLTDLFIKTKVAMLTDRINGKFGLVKWKLYDVLINGGVSECCVATVNGVPFDAGLNSAARTQAGCDIVRTLQKYFNLSAPCFLDNRESCTDIPEMECQTISLYVSPQDRALRVEKAQCSTLFGHKAA